MRKILFLLLLTVASYGQTTTGKETKFPYGIRNQSVQTITTPTYLNTQGTDGTQGVIPSAYIEKTANKTSTISGYSETLYPNEKASHDALDLKLNISDLPTNLTLYPTTTASDISGYVVMVKDIHDVRYNSTAVDVSTPTITTTDQLVSQRISDAGILIGQPGVFNITTFGNIRHLSGSGTATFYFKVFHRDSAGVETLICTSSISAPVTDGGYSEFTASGVWDDGDFVASDRIVIKSYANRIAGGSDPVYQFQFGGTSPVRTLLPVPFSVVDAGYELNSNKQNSLAIDGTGTKYPTVDAVNDEVVKLIGDQTINGEKLFNENISFASGKGIVSNGMTFSGSSTGLAQWVLSSSILGDAGRLHLEPKGKYFSGTKSKTDWMFDAYQLDQSNYRLFNIYNTDDFSLGTNGITALNCKSQGDDNFGIYPIMHFGFQDDGSNGQPMKIAYFDTSETSWRTTYKGAWLETKPVLTGDYVTANFNLYIATNSGNCGVTKPVHTSGSVSDGTVTWTFVKTFVSTNIKPTVLFGDRVDMPKFGFPTVRTQFAKDQLHWYNTFSRYLDNSNVDIVQIASYGTGLRTSTTGGMKIEVENTSQNWILRNSANTGVYRMLASGVISNAIDVVNKGHLDTQLALKSNIASPTFTGTPTAPTATSGTNTTQIATTAFAQGIRPYKVYTAILTQVGTDAPTAIVLENTIGSIVWSRTVIGGYFATLSGAFTTDKTSVLITNGSANTTYIHGASVSTSNVNVITASDGQIDRATIEIRVYN